MNPRGIATDSKGNIWVADTGNNRIAGVHRRRRIHPRGRHARHRQRPVLDPAGSPPTPKATSGSPTPETTASRSSPRRRLPEPVRHPRQRRRPGLRLPRRHRHRLQRQRLGCRHRQRPHPGVSPRANSSASSAAQAPASGQLKTPDRHRHRLRRQRLGRRHLAQPGAEVQPQRRIRPPVRHRRRRPWASSTHRPALPPTPKTTSGSPKRSASKSSTPKANTSALSWINGESDQFSPCGMATPKDTSGSSKTARRSLCSGVGGRRQSS